MLTTSTPGRTIFPFFREVMYPPLSSHSRSVRVGDFFAYSIASTRRL
jgi:hypothetical protein